MFLVKDCVELPDPLATTTANPHKLKQQSSNTFVSSPSEKPSDGEDVEADYDADNDDDDDELDHDYELNEIVIESGKKPGVAATTTAAVTKKMRKIKSALGASGEKSNVTPANPTSGPKQAAPDSTSSSESGFGTVDDEIDPNNINTNPNQPRLSKLDPGKKSPDSVVIDMSGFSKKPNQSGSIDTNSSQFPILQPPRQVVYELGGAGNNGRRRSDEIKNILNDNSSLNSSMCSSSSSLRDKNCCARLFAKLVKFYYSCFCCVSTSQDKPLLCCTWLSIFCCCCPLLAGVSLYFTKRSKRFKLKQKYELADKYSNWAEKLNIASLIIGIIFYAIAFFMITLVIFMYWRPRNS